MRKFFDGGNERGQTLALFAGVLILLFAAVGLVIDGGRLLAARSQAQSAADAGALAGAQLLPAPAATLATAHAYMMGNNPTSVHEHVVTSERYTNDTLTVIVHQGVDFTFLRLLGMSGETVSAEAQSQRLVFSGGFKKNLVPWGIVASSSPDRSIRQNACYNGNDTSGLPIFQLRTSCTIKYGSAGDVSAEFGPIRLQSGSSGANDYRDAVTDGVSEPRYIGDVVQAETGNMVGPTADGVAARMSLPAPAGCSGTTRADVLIDNSDGTTSIRPGCEGSPRIIVVPLLDQLGASLNSRILGFAFMWLEGMETQGAGAGHDAVVGEFISPITRLPDGTYDAPHSRGASAVALIK